MSIVSDSNWIEDISDQKPVHDAALNFYYEVVKRNGKYFLREFRKDIDGSISHERFVEVEYVMGSGNNLRMYFSETGGMLYELPVTWYVHDKKFDLSPGYRDFGNVRFGRFASSKCISCHNSYLTLDSTANNRYQKPFSLGIGCERCHGPGELHVKQAQGKKIRGLPDSAITIVNPRKLPFQRQLDVCQQCHLQGKSWVLKKEDSWFDFRPGNLLDEHRSVFFKAATMQEVIEVGDSPQRLSISKCFQQSNGRMTCITCHDPHVSIKTFSRKYFNNKCLTCHGVHEWDAKKLTVQHETSSDCISCHMKSTGSDNTLHGVTNTDHWIRVNADKTTINWSLLRKPTVQPLTQITAFLSSKDAFHDEQLGEAYLEYFREHDPRPAYLDSGEFYSKAAITLAKNTYRSYLTLARIALHRSQIEKAIEYYIRVNGLNDSLSVVHNELGAAYSQRGLPLKAISAYERAVTLQPNDPVFLESLGIQHYLNGQYSQAEPILERAIQKDDHNSKAIFYLGVIRATQTGSLANALELFRRALELDPAIEHGHLNIGNIYFLQKKYSEAMQEYKAELNMYPKSTLALVNLGKTHAQVGEKQKAREYYRKALVIDPHLDMAKILLMQL